MTKTKAAKPLFTVNVEAPSSSFIAEAVGRQLLKDQAARARIEHAAARCIDATIAKIVTAKATPVVERIVSNVIPNRFSFAGFVEARVREWGQYELIQAVERLVEREHRKAMLTVTKDVKKLAKATLAVMAARQAPVVPKLVRRKRRKSKR